MRKPAAWYFGALKRTVRAALPWSVRPDDAWAQRVLTSTEFQVYCTMTNAERFHGVSVAQCILRRWAEAPRELLAAAILHDVGKVGSPQHWLYRVAVHLAPGKRRPFNPQARGFTAARQALHHHPQQGAELLAARGVDDRVVALVRHHHEPPHTPLQQWLRTCDEEQ